LRLPAIIVRERDTRHQNVIIRRRIRQRKKKESEKERAANNQEPAKN
jgi:hypothetical protein